MLPHRLLGADIGGTFTDLIWWTGTELRTYKLATTPAPEDALLAGIARLGADRPDVLVVHGSTIATNAFLERTGARVVLVTTAGFADVLEIGRQDRVGIYEPHVRKPAPLVPAARRIEAHERLDHLGAVLQPLTKAEARRVAATARAQRPEAIAVCLLHAYANPEHERVLAGPLAAVSPFVYLSSVVDPAYREYERMSTTVLNAYVAPLVADYVARLRAALAGPLRLMGSHGGRQAAGERARPAGMILSGPAGGVVGASAVARAAGVRDVITLDMGGTSTDVALIQDMPTLTTETMLEGLPLRAPMLDIHTIGAGGGSIARFDRGGALIVGPESAGANPGPACYGRGGTAFTVTDAHVLLGHLPPEVFLGGRMRLDADAARAAAGAALAGHTLTGRTAGEIALAEGVLAVADAAMERAVRTVSARRGFDPARFTLCCFGGAGGLHAVSLARSLGMRGVLMPRHAGVLSALGMLLAKPRTAVRESVLAALDALDDATLRDRFARMRAAATAELVADGREPEDVHGSPALEMRYRGQSYELTVPWEDALAATAAAFHEEHRRRFGYADALAPVEVVGATFVAVAELPELPLPEIPAGPPAPPLRHTSAWFGGAAQPTAIYPLEGLAAGQAMDGPAIIAGADSTLLLPPGTDATVDRFGNLHVALES